MSGPAYASQWNTYVPNHRATGGLMVGFSRNADDFATNRFIQIFPVNAMVGLYASYTSRNAARILAFDDSEHLWADGNAAPSGVGNTDSFQYLAYQTQRRAYPFTLGELTVEQADWNILLANSRDMAQQAMTARSMLVYNALVGASWGSNTALVNGGILTSGQDWSTGTSDTGDQGTLPGPNIKKSLQYGTKIIHQQTLGVVKPKDLYLVINPFLAQTMASSSEIQNFIKQSPDALAQIRGDVPSQNGVWGLPDKLYGINVVVEDTVRVSSRKSASSPNPSSATLGYVYDDKIAFLVARPGSLEGIAGSRSFSTLQMFVYKDELSVETMYDQQNKRYMGRVISNYVPIVASTLCGFMFNACQPT